MTFNPPATNITSGVDFFSWVNTTIEGWFFPGAIITIYFVMIIKMLYNNNSVSQAFAATSFVCMILTILLRVADLVSNVFMVIFIILTAIGAVWMNVDDAKFS